MKKIYYGWFVCAACTLMMFVSMGLMSNNFSVFMPMIREEYGLTHAQTSTFVTLRNLASFIATFFIVMYYKKLGPRVGVTIGVLVCGAAYMLYSFSDRYIMFAIAAALSGFGSGIAAMIPISILMSSWFVNNRALAIGVCSSGSGVAMMIMPGISTMIAEKTSLAWAFRSEAIAIFVVAVIIMLLVRNTPQEMGLVPPGYEELKAFEAKQAETAESSLKRKTMPKSVWAAMIVCMCFMGPMANPSYSHISVLLADAGYESMKVAMTISALGAFLTVGKLVFGKLVDSIGGYKSTTIFGICLVAGLVFCCMAYSGIALVTIMIVILLGIGYVITTTGPSIWAADMAPPDKYASTMRTLQIISSAGSLVFSTVPGILADQFGGYVPAYIMFTIQAFVAVSALVVAYNLTEKNKAGLN